MTAPTDDAGPTAEFTPSQQTFYGQMMSPALDRALVQDLRAYALTLAADPGTDDGEFPDDKWEAVVGPMDQFGQAYAAELGIAETWLADPTPMYPGLLAVLDAVLAARPQAPAGS